MTMTADHGKPEWIGEISDEASVVATPVLERGKKKKGVHSRWLLWTVRIVMLVILGGSWQVLSVTHVLDPLFVGTPAGVVRSLWDGLIVSGSFRSALGSTLLGTALGFGLGAAGALIVGLMFSVSPFLEVATDPFFSAFNAIPRIALAPVVILWFGLGMTSKVVLGASLAFFVVLSSVIAGIRGADVDLITLSTVLGASRAKTYLKVVLPSAVPSLFAGLRLGLIYALLGVVSGEIIAASNGLGQLLNYYAGLFQTDNVFAVLLLLGFVGGFVTWLITLLERRMLRWK